MSEPHVSLPAPTATPPRSSALSWRSRAARVAAPLYTGPLPRMALPSYRHELTATLFFAVALATIEGGVISVFARHTFEGVVDARTLNLTVAALGAMSEVANILSFLWASLPARKSITAFINTLQVALLACVGAIALLPKSPTGLVLLVGLILAARLCWSGIITTRPMVWRQNYPPATRASIVGRLSGFQVIVVASVGMLLGWMLDHYQGAFRYALPVSVAIGLVAVWAYGKIRVRGGWKLQRALESGPPVLKPWMGPVVVWRVLTRDRRYAQFMLCMSVLGFGNLMVIPVLVITLKEQFGMGYFNSILITSSIQAVVQVAAIPFWARLLDRAHVVRFRSIHSWFFVAGAGVFTLGAALHSIPVLMAGALVQGVAYGGGVLAWNLGHVDFAPPTQTGQYMATHVTLNGVRGLIAPIFSVVCYELLKSAGFNASVWMLAAAFVVNAAGAAGFVWLRIAMGAEATRSTTRT
jgi:hypothetical protein